MSTDVALNNDLTLTEEKKITTSPMMEFYRGKNVLVTGGTGFIGRLLIEKLLRINVRQIILLSRPKKGKTIQERCDELFGSVVFMNLKKNYPSFMDRVKILDADLQHPGVGLSEESIDYIVKNTQIVFHAASDVRFDQALKKAIEVNVRGTRDLLRICEKIINLELFIYISTAYSNCPEETIKEEFYPPPSNPEKMIALVEAMDEHFEEHINKTINDFIHPWPNTYVYTKALTEDIVRQFGELLPISVVRPSIIIATNEEPIEGWTDNIYGLNGVIAGIALGIIRVMLVNDDNDADIIPADIVVNGVLAAGWQTYLERKHDRSIEAKSASNDMKAVARPKTKIYNCVTGKDNPITYQKIYDYSIQVGNQCPPKRRKLNTSDGSLYQYMNESSGEGFLQEEVPNDEDSTIVPANPTTQQSRPRDSKIPNKTEQDLFAELVEDGKKKYSCKGCRMVFKKPIDLRRHIRTHTGERPFQCDQCSKGFTLKAVLQSHLKTHEAQREMLPCPEKGCSSKFSSKTSLELHRRIHTGLRPFQCGVCTLTFRTSGHMQAHMTSHERLAKRREQSNFELLYRK